MIDKKHPRAASLKIRGKIVYGVKIGVTSKNGLIAQGRGEAFDYLLGEKTQAFAYSAIEASAATLLLAEYPVLSTNGNSSVLCPEEFIGLSRLLSCPIEINLFHRTLKREKLIKNYLKYKGAENIVGIGKDASKEIAGISSKRRFVSPYGIEKADVVFVPLEDGDRTEVLISKKKKVIVVDLNPLSRSAQKATITIVDNLVRSMPILMEKIREFKTKDKKELNKIIKEYSNRYCLSSAISFINKRLNYLAKYS